MNHKGSVRNFTLSIFIIIFNGVFFGQTLYVVDHSSKVMSFDVEGTQLTFLDELQLTRWGYGGVDLAIDNDSMTLFMSSEDTNKIELIDAETLEHIKTITLSGPTDITGIVYDAQRSRLLGTERNSSTLYSMLWDAELETLTLESPYIDLSHNNYACDLAINGNTLYVSEFYYNATTYEEVYSYDLSNDCNYIDTIDMTEDTISIAYNESENTIYGGAWGIYGLTKKTFSPDTAIYKDIETSVVGVTTANHRPNIVFATTVDYNYNWAIQVWDTSNWTQTEPSTLTPAFIYDNSNTDNVTLSGLAGLVVTGYSLSGIVEFTKTADITGCVSPYDSDANEITYTIYYRLDPNFPNDVNDVEIVDFLPAGVDYPVTYTPAIPPISSDPNYDDVNHTYTWNIGTLSPGDSGTLTLTVYVNEKANPYGTLYNQAELTSSLGTLTADWSNTVCGWNPPENPDGIIFVDKDAKGYNTGVSWQHAYVDLQSGLARARRQADAEIWVAEGSYYPTQDGNQNVSFALVDDAEIYGGFRGVETARNQRKFSRYKTYLCGDISETDEDPNSNYVVTAADGITDSTILDGFIICRGVKAGIRLYDQAAMDQLNDPNAAGPPSCDISPNIVNCFVTQNDGDGIHGQLADPNIYACIISDNGGYGIVDANSIEVEIDRCIIRDNGLAGIDAHIAVSGNITNCFIYHNDIGINCFGVYVDGNETYYITIRNNTIVYNDGLAVEAYAANMPVVNSILWGNSDPNQIKKCLPDRCFIDVDSVSGINYNTDPGFSYTEPNACNYHLAADSNCIDAGLTTGIPATEKDIDGETRTYNSLVDIGADEVTGCDDVFNENDYNGDGVVNLIEFSLLSASWMTYDPCSPPDTGDPNFLDDFNPDKYDSRCDYDADGMVYTADLQEFAPDWLWEACWRIAAEGSWFEFYSTGSSQLAVEGLPSAAIKMCVPSAIPAGGVAMMSMPISAVTVELSTADQYLQASNTVDFLNMIYKDELRGQIDQKTWKEFMDNLEKWVDSLAEDLLESQN